jgi:hypothetical protein
MTPGRGLDALVAEKVMGWIPEPGEYPLGMTWLTTDGEETGWYRTEFGSQECAPFDPSEDISAAWLVVEKMKKSIADDICKFDLTFQFDDIDGTWSVGYFGCDYWGDYYSIAKTLPHAICLVALQTVGYNFPNDRGIHQDKSKEPNRS